MCTVAAEKTCIDMPYMLDCQFTLILVNLDEHRLIEEIPNSWLIGNDVLSMTY